MCRLNVHTGSSCRVSSCWKQSELVGTFMQAVISVRRSPVVKVRRSSVVSAPGSYPARHSSLGTAHDNPGAKKKTEQIFPSAQAGQSPPHQGWILYQYCKAKKTRNKQKEYWEGHQKFSVSTASTLYTVQYMQFTGKQKSDWGFSWIHFFQFGCCFSNVIRVAKFSLTGKK